MSAENKAQQRLSLADAMKEALQEEPEGRDEGKPVPLVKTPKEVFEVHGFRYQQCGGGRRRLRHKGSE